MVVVVFWSVAVGVGWEMVAGREVDTTGAVCCVVLAAKASRADPSKPRILDMAGSTSPALQVIQTLAILYIYMSTDIVGSNVA